MTARGDGPGVHGTGAQRPGAQGPGHLAGERTSYATGHLDDSPGTDPLALFDAWMADAFARRDSHGDLPEPTAMVLSTLAADEHGTLRPRSRTVLLKGRDERGFVLYTNLDSAKGRELAAHPAASLLLPWYPLQRQVRIEGSVEPLDPGESDAYFASRPRGSRIGAWASQQSRPISSRQALQQQYRQVEDRFGDGEIPRPPHWGGLRLVPDLIEFWQGRENRLHDRLLYRRSDGGWSVERLQP